MPLVPETKMADVGKLFSLGNLLARKVTWLVLTTTSATLILSRAFGADCMTRIAYIYSLLPRTHSLTFFTNRDSTLSLILSILTYGQRTLSIATYRDNTLSLLHFDFQQSTPRKCIHSANVFFLVLPFWLDFFQPRTQPQKYRQALKEINNQHGRRQVPLRTRCYILYIDILHEILSPHTFYSLQDTFNIKAFFILHTYTHREIFNTHLLVTYTHTHAHSE